MKKFLVFVLFSVCSFFVFAVDLDSVVKKAFSNESVYGDYVQIKQFAKTNRKLESSGKIQISPGLGIVWYSEKPYKSLLVISKTKMVQQIKDKKPIHSPIESNKIYTTIATAFESVFFGDFSQAEKLFEIEQTVDGTRWKLVLKPTDDNLVNYMDYLELGGSQTLETLLVVEKTGDSILYKIGPIERRSLTEQEMAVYEL